MGNGGATAAAMPMGAFVGTSARAAAALAAFHARNLVHGHLGPRTLSWDPQTGEATLQPDRQTGPDEGLDRWIYLAPEQTGRLDRPVDARSDLYTLGMLLYQRLVGVLPFQASDPLGWAHNHLARQPRSPLALFPDLPPQVAAILLKLLAKDPEDRYQTARGLQLDLERCAEALRDEGQIREFPLGTQDFPDRLEPPRKLYGRQAEQAALLQTLTRVQTDGRARLVLLAGGPGVGKSALAMELTRPVVDAGGMLVAGKFDQVLRDVPYAPFVQALRELVRWLLASSEAQVEAWRTRLQQSAGTQAGLLVELVPELQALLGEPSQEPHPGAELPPVPLLPPGEAQARFAALIQRFLGVFAQGGPPLVLFLDDLQWADPASLRLLKAVACDPCPGSLLLVGAYRDTEVEASHPLTQTLADIRAAGTPVETLALGPLPVEPLQQLVADVLHLPVEACAALTRLLHAKTQGNPYFFTQVLTSLPRAGLLSRDASTHAWTWDLARIEAEAAGRDVVGVLTGRLEQASPAVRETLWLAACLGDRVDAAILAEVLNQPLDQVVAGLSDAVREGLLLRVGDGFRFAHDRVRQAAYAGHSADERSATHLRLGRLLWARGRGPRLDEWLFDIVAQLQLGRAHLTDPAERVEVARLHLRAVRKARGSGANRAAADHAQAGLALLGEPSWQSHRDLTLALTLEAAELELASGALAEAERLLEQARPHATGRSEQAALGRIEVALRTTRGDSLGALEVAVRCLRLFDLDLKLRPTVAEVEAAARAVWTLLGDRPIEAIAQLPDVQDQELEAAQALLVDMLPSAYFADLHLHRLVASTSVDLTLRHGLTAGSPMGLAAFGFELAMARRYFEADRVGSVALSLLSRPRLSGVRAKVHNVVGATISIWTRGPGAAIDLLRQGVTAGIESGDGVFACLCSVQAGILPLVAGQPLAEAKASMQTSLAFLRAAQFEPLAELAVLAMSVVDCLQGRTDGEASLNGPSLDEAAFVARLPAAPLPLTATWYHGFKLLVQVIAGDVQGALASDAALRRVLVLLRGQRIEAEAAWLGAMARTAAWDGASAEQRRVWQTDLDQALDHLRTLAATCPEAYGPLALLVAGEVERVAGRPNEALEQLNQAAESAREHGLHQVELVARERSALVCRQRGLDTSAQTFAWEARAASLRWGALGPARRLERQWPALANAPLERATSPANGLDTLAVVQALQALSSEIVLERLLDRLMRVVMAEAGARQGTLLLARPAGLQVVATAAVTGEDVAVTVHDPPLAPGPTALPESLVHYVRRTREPQIVSDAAKFGPFVSDPYVVQRRTRSMLALPILRQGEVRGILYLENDLIANAFTPRRLHVLELLGGQAAISLENAMLYAELKREIAEREKTEAGLLASQAQLAQAQKMEVVGRLSGGIAHDFNNLLTAIGGYSMLALERLEPDHPARRDLEEVQKAGERAAALTRQLLLFSRKQAPSTRPVDLHTLLTGLEKMLRRLIGEDVELVIDSQPDQGLVLADPGQIEQVVLNLVVNARDAMPHGGRLTVSVRREHLEADGLRGQVSAQPGDYLKLAVLDTGVGMDEQTLARLFEPFFTTKEPGKGTGLGLSTVYGIVQQAGGFVTVQSKPGQGSTFEVHLPVSTASTEVAVTPPRPGPSLHGTETVLLVEDDEPVRVLACEILSAHGYRVLVAADGEAALRMHAQHGGEIDLVVTDVVMPKPSGPELARRLRLLAPGTPVLFLSGYTAEAMAAHGLLDEGEGVVQKPFTPDGLAGAVRQVLDRRLGGGSQG